MAGENEKQILHKLLTSKKPELLALYGRRRVGKTFLISEYFEGKGTYFEIIGSKNTQTEVFLSRFDMELSYKFHKGKIKIMSKNWEEAFQNLLECINNEINQKPDQKIILFFDELPWIAINNNNFLSTLEYFWNKYFSRSFYQNILIIMCGSAASWMIRNILYSKGGLHNRVTQVIRLLPFTLKETQLYLESKNIHLEKNQVTEIYMCLGGIPFYLSFIEKGKSAAQNINNLCFRKDGFLFDEFNRLYSSLFDNFKNHLKVIRVLAKVRKGIDRNDIIKKARLPNGGDTTLVLQELEEAGLIQKIRHFKKKTKGSMYRLNDEYSLFYINWIEPVKSKIKGSSEQNYWMQKINTQTWNSWAGYAFESLCIKHINEIKWALGISGVLTYESSWRYLPDKDADERGAQIDLLIERADRVINLCEIKYSQDEYSITKEYKQILENKKRLFKLITKTRCQVFLTMISTFGIRKNDHYVGVVDNQITAERLF